MMTTKGPKYVVSNQARRRIFRSRLRQALFEVRAVLLQGGFRQSEMEVIIALIQPFIESGGIPDENVIKDGLIAEGFSTRDAEEIASAIAR